MAARLAAMAQPHLAQNLQPAATYLQRSQQTEHCMGAPSAAGTCPRDHAKDIVPILSWDKVTIGCTMALHRCMARHTPLPLVVNA